MSTQRTSLGDCPNCRAAIPTGLLLIEYETADGTASYAECPGCDDVVQPT